MSDLDVETVPLTDLVTDEGNARRHSERNLDAVGRSLERFGQRTPIVVHRGVVIAGNARLDAARRLGWTEMSVVRLPDDWTAAEIRAYAIADNRTAELATWDYDELVASLGAIGDAELIAASGYTGEEYDGLLAHLNGRAGASDEVPELPAEPRTRPGDLYVMAEHRLICGDANDPAALGQLLAGAEVGCVLADPPYGIGLDTDYTKLGPGISEQVPQGQMPRTYRPLEGDDRPFDASGLRAHFADVTEQFWFGANYYRRTLSGDDRDGSWLVWDKRNDEGADRFAGSGFELIWSASPHKQDVLRHFWFGMFGSPEARERLHPTQKPVALLSELLERWAPAASVVLDPFAGSGSSLVAAEQTGRPAYLVEIDPAYCDVIVSRWEALTGGTAVRDAEA